MMISIQHHRLHFKATFPFYLQLLLRSASFSKVLDASFTLIESPQCDSELIKGSTAYLSQPSSDGRYHVFGRPLHVCLIV